jgi:radical SAM protein with 4Fe4S-binding SPASM domain
VTENIAAFLERRRQSRRRTPRLAIEVLQNSPVTGGPAPRAANALRREFLRRHKKLGLDEVVFKGAHNWAGHLGAARPAPGFSACTFPWNALVVFFNGDVVACAQDFFGRQRLGNAGDAQLLDIWNGMPMQQLRRAHAAGDTAPFPACRECDRVRRRTLAGVPLEFLQRLILRRMP